MSFSTPAWKAQDRGAATWAFFGAWLRLSVAMICAVFVVMSLILLWWMGPQLLAGDAMSNLGQLNAIVWLVPSSLLLGLLFTLLGGPLLFFRKWIVSARFPYLRWGYAAVVAYGPMLLILVLGQDAWSPTYRPWMATYEAIALIATVLYGHIAAWLDAEGAEG